ncbi:MAG: hypothetical protein QME12_04720 [Nanoarchaeota archaeon]|nr:hypothetical protein [Nanoarchaeota archaeon]
MEQENKGGLEAVVSEKPMQKKSGLKKLLIIAEQLPFYMITAVSGIGLAVSLYFGGMSAYKAVDKFLAVNESQIAAAEASDEPSPYNECYVYAIIFGMCGISGTAFGYAAIASVKEAKEKIQEELEKKEF